MPLIQNTDNSSESIFMGYMAKKYNISTLKGKFK